MGAVHLQLAVPLDELLPAAVSDAVRAALQPELARLDVPVSTRATPADLPQGGAGTTYDGVLT